jgi:hypothetical protein
MPTIELPPENEQGQRWRGIDQRNTGSDANPATAWDAVNVDLTIGGEFKSRDCLEEYAKLPPGTHGLYSMGGKLRVAGPAGHALPAVMPPGIKLDLFGDLPGVVTSLSRYVRMRSVTNWGISTAQNIQPYMVLETAAGQFLHHWITDEPAGLSSPIDTSIATPFPSGPDVVKLHGHLWAFNRYSGDVHHTSVSEGPGQWFPNPPINDTGFISPQHHALSEPQIRGLGQHQGNLMVVYGQAIQFWKVDEDYTLNQFLTALNGPGTKRFATLANVIGDVYYFSDGGFRSLATQTVTGELREGDIGAPVNALTRKYNTASDDTAFSVWSQARSQYLTFFNDYDAGTCEVFAYTSLLSFGVAGWTRWVLPVNIEYATSHDDEIFLRGGDTIYRFSQDLFEDYVDGSPIAVSSEITTQFINGGAPRLLKNWLTMDVDQDGICNVELLIDQRDRSLIEPIAYGLDGPTFELGNIPIQTVGHAVAFRFTSTSKWEFDGCSLDVEVLGG